MLGRPTCDPPRASKWQVRLLLQDNLSSARRNLDAAEAQMRSMRDELRAEIESGNRETNN